MEKMSEEINTPPDVASGENLYRSIRLVPNNFYRDSEGNWHISSEAFSDIAQRVSLFRHQLCDNPPSSNPPRLNADDVLACLIAGRIMSETIENTPEQGMDKGRTTTYRFFIEPDQSDNQHISHVVVVPNPEFTSRKVFDKLKRRLVILIEKCLFPPPSEFVDSLRTR
jgi:hypothetical protein